MAPPAQIGQTDDSHASGVASVARSGAASLLCTALAVTGRFGLAVCNRLSVESALRDLQSLTGAQNVSLLRLSAGYERIRFVARTDATCAPPAAAMLAQVLSEIGGAGGAARLPDDPRSSARSESEGTPGRVDACMVLRRDRTEVDLIWMQFPEGIAADVSSVLPDIVAALAEIWAHRETGLAGALAVDDTRRQKSKDDERAAGTVLGLDNVFGLSRAEFRVCHLLRKGLTPKQIAGELGLSIATVRSHLSGIYAKTDTSGQVGVLHRLNEDASADLRQPAPSKERSRDGAGSKA